MAQDYSEKDLRKRSLYAGQSEQNVLLSRTSLVLKSWWCIQKKWMCVVWYLQKVIWSSCPTQHSILKTDFQNIYLCSYNSNPVPVQCNPKRNQLGECGNYSWYYRENWSKADSRSFKDYLLQSFETSAAKNHIWYWHSTLQSDVPHAFMSPKILWWVFLFLLMLSAGCFSGVTITTCPLFPNRPLITVQHSCSGKYLALCYLCLVLHACYLLCLQ